MHLHRRLLLLIVLLVGGAACGGDTKQEEAANERATGAVDDGGVDVTDAGQNPRRPLRLQLEQGQKLTTKMTMAIRIRVAINGQPTPATPVPATEVTIESSVDDVADNGDVTFSHVYSSVDAVPGEGVDPATLQAVRQTTAQMKGVRGTGVIGPTGAARSDSMDTSRITDPTLKSTLDSLSSQIQNLTVPFPAEAVGRGATWQVKRSAVLSGIHTDILVRYRLAELSKDSYRLDVEQDVTAPRGPVALPGIPQGTSVEIVDYKMRSSGSINGALDRLFPRDSTLKSSGDMTMAITGPGGQSGNMVQHIELDLGLADAA